MKQAPLPLLKVEGLRVERDRSILDGIDWQVQPGEHWAILGPNGSGKTSLLKVCCGYMPATRGTVQDREELDGSAGAQPMRERIGLVSHSLQSRIEPTQTVIEVIASGRRARLNHWGRIPAGDESRINGILRQVRLVPQRSQFWGQLSQGERQRALLGRALMSGRRLLFLDEPCAGLDPVARRRFLEHLDDFLQRPRSPSAVLVTHHVEEIVPAITHVLLLRAGRVIAAGPKKEALSSRSFSDAFDTPARIRRSSDGRYQLRLELPLRRRWL